VAPNKRKDAVAAGESDGTGKASGGASESGQWFSGGDASAGGAPEEQAEQRALASLGEIGDVVANAVTLVVFPTFPMQTCDMPGIPARTGGAAAAAADDDDESALDEESGMEEDGDEDPVHSLSYYRSGPVSLPASMGFTRQMTRAVLRIFRLCDADCDGYLSTEEYKAFVHRCYGERLSDEEVVAAFQVLSVSFANRTGFFVTGDSTGASERAFRQEQRDLSFFGRGVFVQSMLDSPSRTDRWLMTPLGFAQTFVKKLEESSPNLVWAELHAFGYRLGHLGDGTLGLVLDTPADFTDTAQFAVAADASLQLTGMEDESLFPRDSGDPLPAGRLLASPTAIGFLARLFFFHSRGEPTLPLRAFKAIFQVTPAGMHPFGEEFPFACQHNRGQAIGLDAWIGLWQSLLLTRPVVALQALYEVGWRTSQAKTREESLRGNYSQNPTRAVRAGPPRRAGRVDALAFRRIFVLGSHDSGKTSVVQHFMAEGSLSHYYDSAFAAASKQVVRQYVSTVDRADFAEGSEAWNAMPRLLAITEWPASMLEEAMAEARTQADGCLIVVDPASVQSLAFFVQAVEMLPDVLPTAAVCMLSLPPKARVPAWASGAKGLSAGALADLRRKGLLCARMLCAHSGLNGEQATEAEVEAEAAWNELCAASVNAAHFASMAASSSEPMSFASIRDATLGCEMYEFRSEDRAASREAFKLLASANAHPELWTPVAPRKRRLRKIKRVLKISGLTLGLVACATAGIYLNGTSRRAVGSAIESIKTTCSKLFQKESRNASLKAAK
jgi:hypothetical protein